LSANETTLHINTAIFREEQRWYVACFSNRMKMQRSTPKEAALYFSPVTPQRVNESPSLIPLVCIG